MQNLVVPEERREMSATQESPVINHRLEKPRQYYPNLGQGITLVLICAYVGLWIAAKPAGITTENYVGQFSGALAMVFMSLAIVLLSFAGQLERFFGGYDKLIWWHRWFAVLGFALVYFPHQDWSNSPERLPAGALLHEGRGDLAFRAYLNSIVFGEWAYNAFIVLIIWAIIFIAWRLITGRVQSLVAKPVSTLNTAVNATPILGQAWRFMSSYELWRLGHYATVIAVGFAFLHSILVPSVLSQVPILRSTFIAVGGIGLASFLVKLVTDQLLNRPRRYQVSAVSRGDHGVTELTMTPLGKPLKFQSGQFALTTFPSGTGLQRHPFTLASSPDESSVRVSVKALGDFTSKLSEFAHPGMTVRLRGPYGGLEFGTDGDPSEVWIAGGVGITPMLSRLRDRQARMLPSKVTLFYSTRSAESDAFAAELRAIAEQEPRLDLRLIDTSVQSRLKPEDITDTIDNIQECIITIVGPAAMASKMRRHLRSSGVSYDNIHFEHFQWR